MGAKPGLAIPTATATTARGSVGSPGWGRAAHPVLHVGLVSAGVYTLWSYPLHPTWAAVPILVSLVSLRLLPGRAAGPSPPGADPSPLPYAATGPAATSLWHRIGLFLLFVAAPVGLGMLGVVPWVVGAFAAAFAAVVLPYPWSSAPAVPTPRVTAGWFCLTLLAATYALELGWPFLASRPVSAPMAVASVVAGLERWAGDGGGSAAVATRTPMTSLAGGGDKPRTLLLSADHLHVLLLAMLLTGALARTWALCESGRWRGSVFDLASVGVVGGLYVTTTWWDVLGDRLSPTLWPLQWRSLVLITGLWVAVRALLLECEGRGVGFCPSTGPPTGPPVPVTLRPIGPGGLLAGVIAAGGCLWFWHEPGTAKPGRVVIDERHSDWERSDLPMEAEHFGVKTVYNYAFLKEILGKHYPSVTSNEQPLTRELLADCDVLILKTPTKAYEPAELDAIRDFVRGGGGLWLIGDHTNIFGMNTYLNQVAEPWGVRFNADAVTPLRDYYQQVADLGPIPPYSECGKRSHECLRPRPYLNHPVVGRDFPYTTILTSCSVSAPLDCEYVSISRGTFSDHARFGPNTFFGNMEHDDDERYGCVLQNVALRVGRGRVATWSDSTLFSNFSMCMTGVPDLALGYVGWLNRTNDIPAETLRGGRLAVLGLAAVVLLVGRRHPAQLLFGSLAGFVLVGCLVPAVDRLNTRAYPPRDVTAGFRTVGFDEQYSRMELPNKDHVHQGDVKAFESFYVLMQRLHLMPVSGDRLRDVTRCDVIVLINPLRDLADADAERLRAALADGRSVVLLFSQEAWDRDDAEETAGRFNRLLEHLGVGERFEALPAPKLADFFGPLTGGSVLFDVPLSARVRTPDPGTTVLLRSGDDEPVAVARRCGPGRLVLMAAGEAFSNAGLGEPGTVPDTMQSNKLRLGMRLMSEAVTWQEDQREFREPWDRLLRRAGAAAPRTGPQVVNP